MPSACQLSTAFSDPSPAVGAAPAYSANLPHRHPSGFYVLCLVVACERWAAYTLASLSVLMLSERYGYTHAEALRLMSLANAASYLGGLPGGIFVDRVIGRRRALAMSAVCLTLAYAALVSSRALALIPALLFLVLGNGLFKPSTQAVLMGLYPRATRRMEAIQTWFYVAANAGAASGALVTDLVVRQAGWGGVFALATVAMLTACALLASSHETLRTRFLIEREHERAQTLTQRSRQSTVAILTFAMLAYTVCAAQVEGSLLLWAQERTNRVVLGFEVPAAWFVALPSLLVVVFGPAQLAWLPHFQRRIDTRNLIAIGLLAVSGAFVVLLAASTDSVTQRSGISPLVGAMVLLVSGELLVAPLGLAQVLRLTPSEYRGLAVGAWYLAGAIKH